MGRKLTKYELLELFEKQKQGVCTPEEESLLYQWFENVEMIESVTFVSTEEKEMLKADMFNTIRKGMELPQGKKKVATWMTWTAGLAAAVFLGFFIWTGLSYYKDQKWITVIVPAGIQKMPITLPDSSLVWLSAGSSLSYPRQFKSSARNMSLSGTGYFLVRPNKKAPFTVDAGQGLSVKVLGTSFVLEAGKKSTNMEVSVVTGRVQVNESGGQLSIVTPGEMLSFSMPDKHFTKGSYDQHFIRKWAADSNIHLVNASLSELKVLLQTTYHITLNYETTESAPLRFNMSYPKDLPMDEVLLMLNDITGMTFTRTGENVSVKSR